MQEITLNLFADLPNRRLITEDGGEPRLPALVLGDQVPCSLRFLERVDNAMIETRPIIRSLRASIGQTLEPPIGGHFQLMINGNETAPIPHNSSGINFSLAIDGTPKPSVHMSSPGCWIICWADGEARSITPSPDKNHLFPTCFIRCRNYKRGLVWFHEVRLIRAPLAFTGSFERILPPAPTVERIQPGGSDSGNPDIIINEIQALQIPREFLNNDGGYVIKFDFRKTRVLAGDDGPAEIEDALNAMYRDGIKRFSVSLPFSNQPYIEFVGPYENTPFDLLEISVAAHAPGIITFTLDLNRAELADALRRDAQITRSFEVELEIIDSDTPPEEPGEIVTAFQQDVVLRREQIFSELDEVPKIDWLRPPSPVSYAKFAANQIITGSQHYVATFGNNVSRIFSFAHNLGTSAMHVSVISFSGEILTQGIDYTIHTGSDIDNELVLEIPDGKPTPYDDALQIVISTAGPVSVFQQHNHQLDEIIGLNTILDTLSNRLTQLENLIPTANPGISATTTPEPLYLHLSPITEIYPGRFPAGFELDAELASVDKNDLPRVPGLLPAIHKASATDVSALPDNPVKNDVIRATAAFQVPGGLGRRAVSLAINDYAAYDGRVWYRVIPESGTTTFYPFDFERELFLFHISPAMLRIGRNLEVVVHFSTRLFSTDPTRRTRAQWVFSMEIGALTREDNPAETGENIKSISWQPAFLQHRIILEDVLKDHRFGARITRRTNEIILDKMLYDYWEGTGIHPDSADFVFRARLTKFDTEDGLSDPRGFVGLQMPTSDGDPKTTYATIN